MITFIPIYLSLPELELSFNPCLTGGGGHFDPPVQNPRLPYNGNVSHFLRPSLPKKCCANCVFFILKRFVMYIFEIQ